MPDWADEKALAICPMDEVAHGWHRATSTCAHCKTIAAALREAREQGARDAFRLDINDPQRRTLIKIAQRYPHGWHMADLVVRQDGREQRYEADWALQVARAIAARGPMSQECGG